MNTYFVCVGNAAPGGVQIASSEPFSLHRRSHGEGSFHDPTYIFLNNRINYVIKLTGKRRRNQA